MKTPMIISFALKKRHQEYFRGNVRTKLDKFRVKQEKSQGERYS